MDHLRPQAFRHSCLLTEARGRHRPLAQQGGFTLTELAIVMSVIALILGAVWVAADMVTQRVRSNDSAMELKSISDNIRAAYSAVQHFSQTSSMNDVTAAMVSAGVFPSNMIVSGHANPLNPEGGDTLVFITPNSPGATNTQFELLFNTTPQTCSNLLAFVAGAANDLGIAYVYDDVHGWQDPTTNSLDVTSFTGCTQSAFTFKLHP